MSFFSKVTNDFPFKVGDKVRLIDNDHGALESFEIGKIFTVRDVFIKNNWITLKGVTHKGNSVGGFRIQRFELVSSRLYSSGGNV